MDEETALCLFLILSGLVHWLLTNATAPEARRIVCALCSPDKSKKQKNGWGCEACLRSWAKKNNNNNQKNNKTLLLFVSVLHLHKFKCILERRRAILRKSDFVLSDPPVFGVLVLGVTHSFAMIYQREIMHSHRLIITRLVGLAKRWRYAERSKEHEATLGKSMSKYSQNIINKDIFMWW